MQNNGRVLHLTHQRKAQGSQHQDEPSPLTHVGTQALPAHWPTKTTALIGVQMSWPALSEMVANLHAKPANHSSA